MEGRSDTGSGERSQRQLSAHRRRVLQAGGVGIASVAGIGQLLGGGRSSADEGEPAAVAGPTPDAEDVRVDDYESVTTVDVDPGEEVSGIVDEVESGELLVFPPGRYAWTAGTHVTADGWGIWCHEDTVFEVPTGWGDGEEAEVIATYDRHGVADDFLLHGLTFDAEGRAAPGIHLGVARDATVDGLTYLMDGPTTDQRHENALAAYVKDPDGTLTIEDYRQFNNGALGRAGNGHSRIGIWVGPRNEGTVYLSNPVLQGFPNNGCYVSKQPGRVVVEGGLLANNNVSAVRVSGNVEVRGTTVLIDLHRYLDGPGILGGEAHNMRGFWGEARGAGTEGGLVRDVSVVLQSYRRCTGLATLVENPRMTLRGCQFYLGTAIDALQPDDGELVVEDCVFDGPAAATAGIGTISGASNDVDPPVEPGTVPVADADGATFDWSATHPETPGRARSGR
jgi:hypothetical protein